MINVLEVILNTHHKPAYPFPEKNDKLVIFLLTVEIQLPGKSCFFEEVDSFIIFYVNFKNYHFCCCFFFVLTYNDLSDFSQSTSLKFILQF